jgi:hypothetical protein
MDFTRTDATIVAILFLPSLALYFLPSLIARSKRNHLAIFFTNLFTAWCVIAWIALLIWAITNDPGAAVARRTQIVKIVVGLVGYFVLILAFLEICAGIGELLP